MASKATFREPRVPSAIGKWARTHTALTEPHNLAATLSRVETRIVAADYTVQFNGKWYQIARTSVRVGMKGQKVRVEARLDGSLAMRFEGAYLDISASMFREQERKSSSAHMPVRKDHNRGARSRWMRDYTVIATKPIWGSIRESNRSS